MKLWMKQQIHSTLTKPEIIMAEKKVNLNEVVAALQAQVTDMGKVYGIIEQLELRIEELEKKLEGVKGRDRGPSSTREMTDDDARRVLIGDLKEKSHKVAAEELGLSYAQVYSCRGFYTFKHIHKEIEVAKKEAVQQ